MASPSGRLNSIVSALRGTLQRRQRRDDDRGVISLESVTMLNMETLGFFESRKQLAKLGSVLTLSKPMPMRWRTTSSPPTPA
jgi:hypothetical protein